MLRRLTFADWAAGLAVALGLLAVFLPWYSYRSGSAHITVNGFRASLLGDIFFLGIAALGMLMLIRQGVIQDPAGLKQRERTGLLATATVMGTAVLLQLILIYFFLGIEFRNQLGAVHQRPNVFSLHVGSFPLVEIAVRGCCYEAFLNVGQRMQI